MLSAPQWPGSSICAVGCECPALRSLMPFAHSKKKAHIEPSSLYCCDKLCCHLPHEQAY